MPAATRLDALSSSMGGLQRPLARALALGQLLAFLIALTATTSTTLASQVQAIERRCLQQSANAVHAAALQAETRVRCTCACRPWRTLARTQQAAAPAACRAAPRRPAGHQRALLPERAQLPAAGSALLGAPRPLVRRGLGPDPALVGVRAPLRAGRPWQRLPRVCLPLHQPH